MERFFGIVVSDRNCLACCLQDTEGAYKINRGVSRGALGTGYFSEGEVLVKKRPVLKVMPSEELAGDIRSNVLMLSFSEINEGHFRVEETQPFRFRNYLSVISGKAGEPSKLKEAILFHIPAYLKKNIKGDSLNEYIFHLFLSYLHDAGKIDSLSVGSNTINEAMISTVLLLPKLAEKSHEELPRVSWMLTNGSELFMLAAVSGVYFKQQLGLLRCSRCSDLRATPSQDPHYISHPNLKYGCVVMGDHFCHSEGSAFTHVPSRTILTLNQNGEVTSRSF